MGARPPGWLGTQSGAPGRPSGRGPDSAPADTINKACASGMQAIASGAQAILLGESDVVLAGGIESMSRMPYLIDAIDARWGHKMGNFTLVDAMYRDGFQCPLSNLIMGETAEVLARQYGITREESDCFALESQKKAAAAHRRPATSRARSRRSTVTAKGKPTVVDRDEHPRPETTIESLRKLPPAFHEVEGHAGIITAGSSSGDHRRRRGAGADVGRHARARAG